MTYKVTIHDAGEAAEADRVLRDRASAKAQQLAVAGFEPNDMARMAAEDSEPFAYRPAVFEGDDLRILFRHLLRETNLPATAEITIAHEYQVEHVRDHGDGNSDVIMVDMADIIFKSHRAGDLLQVLRDLALDAAGAETRLAESERLRLEAQAEVDRLDKLWLAADDLVNKHAATIAELQAKMPPAGDPIETPAETTKPKK